MRRPGVRGADTYLGAQIIIMRAFSSKRRSCYSSTQLLGASRIASSTSAGNTSRSICGYGTSVASRASCAAHVFPEYICISACLWGGVYIFSCVRGRGRLDGGRELAGDGRDEVPLLAWRESCPFSRSEYRVPYTVSSVVPTVDAARDAAPRRAPALSPRRYARRERESRKILQDIKRYPKIRRTFAPTGGCP